MFLLLVIKILISILYLIFRGFQNKYNFAVKSDFHTSMVKGLIPDQYTLDRHKEQTYISDQLKNNVRNMLFK